MAIRRSDNEARIKQSVFDRLIDLEPNATSEPLKSHTQTLADMKRALRRDLDWLLNTRRTIMDLDEGLVESQKSLAVYGLPDFVGTSLTSSKDQRAFVKEVENALKIFAPQLIDLKISYSPPNEIDRSISFRIEARIDVEPTPEPVVFDTVLQVGSGEFGVKEA